MKLGVVVRQVAIAQFSDDARTEFKLNSYSDKERLLDAINKITYKGGNTKTGESNGVRVVTGSRIRSPVR